MWAENRSRLVRKIASGLCENFMNNSSHATQFGPGAVTDILRTAWPNEIRKTSSLYILVWVTTEKLVPRGDRLDPGNTRHKLESLAVSERLELR